MKFVPAIIPILVCAVLPQIVPAQITTTTVLAVTPAAPVLGTPVVLTATVTPATATGSVTFYSDSSVFLGRTALTNGTATVTTLVIPVGSHALTARYNGDANNARSLSAPVPVTVTAGVGAGLIGGLVAGTAVPTGTLPVDVAFGDFNGDGKIDLVTANQTSNNVTVALGNGDGTFQPGVAYATGTGPDAVAVADINGDGKLDLIVSNASDNTVAILFGSGAGSFGTPNPYAAGSGPRNLFIADFNSDGFPDIAVTSGNVNQVSILLNTASGNGTFYPGTDIPLGGAPKGLVVGDFNGDGYPDLAIANFSAVLSHVSILLNVGDGTFGNPTNLNVDSGPLDLVTGDWNGDGKADIAVACFNTNTVDVIIGNGDGTFGPAAPFSAGTGPYSLVSTDFNGDSKLDLAAVDNSSNAVTLLFGNGDGTFQTSSVLYPTGAAPRALISADFNGDTRADLAIANSTDNTISIYLGLQASSVTLSASPNPAAPGQPVTLTATVSPASATGTVTFFDNGVPLGTVAVSGGVATLTVNGFSAGTQSLTAAYSGDANFAPSTSGVLSLNVGGIVTPTLTVSSLNPTLGQPVTLTVTVSPGTATGEITFYDGSQFLAEVPLAGGQASYTTSLLNAGPHTLVARFDGGNGNLAATSNTVAIVVSATAAGGFTPPTSYAAGAGASATLFADWNRDGISDAVTANFLDNTVTIFLGSAGGTFTTAATIPVGTNPSALATGDFNGDGVTDLLVANNGGASVSLLLGNGDGSFQTPVAIATNAMPSGLAVADFNGDGFADFAVSEAGANTVSVFLGSGNGTFSAPTSITVAGGLKGIAAGNFRIPLLPDLAVAAGNGVYILLNNGDGTFAAPVLYGAGSGPIAVAVADFGNGQQDLVVVNSLGNNVSVLLGTGTGAFAPAVNYAVGTFPQAVAVGDYNGDGKLDLAVANEGSGGNTGSISRLLGNGDGTFGPAVNFPDGTNGAPTGIATAGLTGTGQADLAIANFSGKLDILFALNASSVTLVADPNPDPTGGPVTLTATVVPSSATGTVTFLDGALSVGTAPVVNGTATVTVQLPAGNQTLTAAYSGDAVYGPSTSPAITDTIGQIPTNITLTVNPPTATFGLPVTFTSTVTTPGVTGNVTFLSGSIIIGEAPLVNGTATLQSVLLPAGPQIITARYDGSQNFAGSVSTTAALNVVAAQGYSFNPPVPIPSGFPVSVAAGDFNGDGKADLVVANSGISILLGNGAGAFTPGESLNAGTGPTQVAVADFNADGKQDIAVSNAAGDSVTVLIGDGDGTFGNPVSFGAGSGPSSLVVADFNGDGLPDIAVANKNDGSVSLLIGHGDGTFAPAISIGVGAANSFIAAGDFNNDGAPDLVVADFANNAVWLLLNTGNGTFGAPVSFAAGSGPTSIAVGDFNRDGFPDIAVSDQTAGNTVAILLGTGAGSFQPASFQQAGTSPQYVVASDFNGDGILDLLAADQPGTVSVLLGLGNGTFQNPFAFSTGADPVSLAIANFTGNGKAQIAAASLGTNTVSLLLDGPAALATYAGNQQTVPAESTFPTQLAVLTTGFGNPVGNIPVTFVAPASGASGIFSGSGLSATAYSNSDGVATAPYFTANTFAGPYTVTAVTGTTTTSTTTFSLTNLVTSCTYTVTPTSLAFDNNGGSGFLTIMAVGPSCAWNATTSAPWIQFGNAAGVGSGTATAIIQPNTTGVARSATILVGGKVIPVNEAATTQIFADVPPSAYYFDAANILYAKGITTGCSANPLDYCPTTSILRSQMAIFLVRSVYNGDNFTASPIPYFNDVPVGSFGFQWIQKLYELGITTGCGNGDFCPNSPVTRAQMAIFLVRVRLGSTAAFNYPLTPFFTDVPANAFGFDWIQRIKEDQITNGCSATQYCPTSNVTRGDMAILLLRAAYNLLLPANYPAISQVSPNNVAAGGSATLTITGLNTNWVQGVVSLIPLPNITFGPVTVVNATTLSVPVTVAPNAAIQPFSITAVSGFEEDVLPNGFTVSAP